MPASYDLHIAIDNSRLDQTYNTPALATIFLMAEQVDWMNGQGGLTGRCRAPRDSSDAALRLGGQEPVRVAVRRGRRRCARRSSARSTSTSRVDAAAVAKVLRANGIVDTEPYRKLGRNQLRIAMFPAIEPADVEALTACIDHVVEQLS